MAAVAILISKSQHKVKEKLQRKLCWYNLRHEEQKRDEKGNLLFDENGKPIMIEFPKMEEFEGGELSFSYDIDKKKTIIGVKDLEYVSYKEVYNIDQIEKWVEENKEELGLSIIDGELGFVTVAFNENDTTKVENSLYENRLEYDLL